MYAFRALLLIPGIVVTARPQPTLHRPGLLEFCDGGLHKEPCFIYPIDWDTCKLIPDSPAKDDSLRSYRVIDNHVDSVQSYCAFFTDDDCSGPKNWHWFGRLHNGFKKRSYVCVELPDGLTGNE